MNSFGFGGANAHVILEEAPKVETAPCKPGDHRAVLVPLSARSSGALKAMARSYGEFLRDKDASGAVSLRNISYTTAFRRGHYDHRLALAVHSKEELEEHLEAFVVDETRAGMSCDRVVSGVAPKLVFVFSGMGSQWWAMGRQLLELEPAFLDVIRRCDEALRRHAGWSLLDELTAVEERSRIGEPQIGLPATFAVQIALAGLLQSWGVEPAAIAGHSMGEVTAAHVAGALDMDDAIQVIFHQSRLLQSLSGEGAVLAIGTGEEEALALLTGYQRRVSIAAVNGPADVTLSGQVNALNGIAKLLDEKEVFHQFLPERRHPHSPRIGSLKKKELLASLRRLRVPGSPEFRCFPRSPDRPSKGPKWTTIIGTATFGARFAFRR